jgi:septum formation protein
MHQTAPSGDQPQGIVLASASPRRRELLAAAGIPFDVVPSSVEERAWPDEAPEQFCLRVAAEKARDVAGRLPREEKRLVLAADTIVVLERAVLGKPGSRQEAAAMLRRLAGRTHAVFTGVCVHDPLRGNSTGQVVRTDVRFAPLSEEEIQEYIATGEPMDKAGAYAIQGRASRFVEHIEGCYFNVVGLPIPTVYRMLREMRSRVSGLGSQV